MNQIRTLKQVRFTFDEGGTTDYLLKDRGDGYGDRRYAVDCFSWDAERTEQDYNANIEVSDNLAEISAFFNDRTINNSVYEGDKVEVIIENCGEMTRADIDLVYPFAPNEAEKKYVQGLIAGHHARLGITAKK